MKDLRNDFGEANRWQLAKRNAVLAPFYRHHALDGRFVFLDKGWLSTVIQKRHAVDKFLQSRKDGSAVAIEEKLVQWPGYRYTAYCFETHSCTKPGRESPGWMVYGSADILAYGFEQACKGIDLHLIDFPRLQAWFREREDIFPDFGPLRTLNATKGKKVSIEAVKEAGLLLWRGMLAAPIHDEAAE